MRHRLPWTRQKLSWGWWGWVFGLDSSVYCIALSNCDRAWATLADAVKNLQKTCEEEN